MKATWLRSIPQLADQVPAQPGDHLGLPGDPGVEPVELVARPPAEAAISSPEEEYDGVSHRSGSTSSGGDLDDGARRPEVGDHRGVQPLPEGRAVAGQPGHRDAVGAAYVEDVAGLRAPP